MKLIKSTMAFLVLVLSTCYTNAQSFSLKDFKCCWQLKDMVYESNGGSYGPDDVKRVEGQIICFNKDTLNILGDTITDAKYTIKKESTIAFTGRNFQVYEDIPKWFKITADSVYTIKLFGKYNTEDSLGNPSQSNTDYELAYDSKYLYLNDGNGELFRLTKYTSDMKKNFGRGSAVKEFALMGNKHTLTLSYVFYTDPDEIIVYDQNGDELYHSEMTSTKQMKNVTIKLKNTTKLTVKIVSKNPDSRWGFWFDTK